MKFMIKMPKSLSPYFQQELLQASSAFHRQEYLDSWRHLERAHVIGQPYPAQHTIVHWRMLVFGLRTKNFKEVLGQLPRLFVGGVKSFVGVIPVGNTGGANVPALHSMDIQPDIKEIIDSNTL